MWLAGLAGKFSKSREATLQTHYLLTRDDVRELQWVADKPYLVASRSEMFSKLVDLSGVPADAEQRFLSMQALRHSPYEEFSSYFVMLDTTHRMLWIWDAGWERECRKALPPTMQNAAVLPETVLHPAADDGAYLRACAEGCELQLWSETGLVSSRWFPEEPTGPCLTTALRAERVDKLAGRDTEVLWLHRPWSETAPDWKSLVRNEKNLFTAAAAILLLVTGIHLGSGIGTGLKTSWAENEIESLGEDISGPLQQRSLAERQRDINNEWISVFVPFSQIEVVAAFTAALADSDYELVNWEYVDGNLKVVILDEDIQTREVVSELEKRELFEALRIEPGHRQGESVISMQLPSVNQYRQLGQ